MPHADLVALKSRLVPAPVPDPPEPAAPAEHARSPEAVAAKIAALSAKAGRARWLPAPALRWGVRCLALVVAVALWHLLSANKVNFGIRFENIPTPGEVADQLGVLLGTAKFFLHIAASLERIFVGYALAVVSGILVGVVMGRSRFAEDFFLPYIELLRPIPAVAWIPTAILLWPTEQSSIIFIIFLGAFFPIVLNTVQGVVSTPEVLVRAGRSLGGRSRAIFWQVILPGALPSISTGLAIGMGVAWFSLLAGEIISGQYGIGYFTWSAYTLVQYPNIVVGMLATGLLGTGSTWLIKLATRPFLRWQEAERR
jgi:NitT/TauT family transport system permease protein